MKNGRWVLSFLVVCWLLIPLLACGEEQEITGTPLPSASATASPPPPAADLATATTPPLPTTIPPTAAVSGPTITAVQFALDVDENGQLIFPATEFVLGVTRIYARFSYLGLGNVSEVTTAWYLNENPVSLARLAWDGGDEGAYIMWLEDPNGLARGEWRWELGAGDITLGGGTLTIGGAPAYKSESLGLSFDPPPNWKSVVERTDAISFSSPDQRRALALHVAPGAGVATEITAADLAQFQLEHPEAEVVKTEGVTMAGEEAILQQVRYKGQEADEFLFIVSALHAGSTYSLWLLGPAEDEPELKTQLVSTLHSIRFLTDD